MWLGLTRLGQMGWRAGLMSACRRRLLCFSEETVAQAASMTDTNMGLQMYQNPAVGAKICEHVVWKQKNEVAILNVRIVSSKPLSILGEKLQ